MLQLYDPDRSQALLYNGEIRAWGDFLGSLRAMLGAAAGEERRRHPHPHRDHYVADDGRPVRAPFRSSIRRRKWHQWEPAGPHSARAGAMQAFGAPVNTYYNLGERERDRLAGFRLPGLGSGQPALRAAVRGAAARARRQHRNEPAVRRRADADADRREGGPSAAAARGRYRRVRVGAGHRRWARRTAPSRATTTTSTSGSARSRAICSTTRARAW